MLNLWHDVSIRKAQPGDEGALIKLLQKRSFIHRHLGWDSPLSWLDSEPFFVLDWESSILAALACPPDEDGITWLRLFAVSPGYSISEAWRSLWPPAEGWLKLHAKGVLVNCLIMDEKMSDLLLRTRFEEVARVVVLVWNAGSALRFGNKSDRQPREMRPDDLERVYEIDKVAFELIWRNSLSQLQAAFQEKFSATVVEVGGIVAAYQISTLNSRGGHLARLAVDPDYQGQGLATGLLDNLLDFFQDQGIVEVTVNTQESNQASLELYDKIGFKQQDDIYPVLQYKVPG
jgi:ribosomal protein S18 acetylase RimI-like enzyme